MRRAWRYVLFTVLALSVLSAAGVAVFVAQTIAAAPDLSEINWATSTVIYDREGNEVYRLHGGENRIPVRLSQIPEHVRNAFIAVEDPRFRSHFGVDPRGLARAAWRTGLYLLGLPGGRVEGGSTISQQLARSGWLTQEVTLRRKLQEAWIAIQLERKFSKDQILEMYLNQIYFGQGAYGIQAAAETFFGKDVSELNIAEAAQLAGMVNGPSIYDPYVDMEASLARRAVVLDAMLREGVITEAQHEEAMAFRPTLANTFEGEADRQEGNDFIDYVISILTDAQPGLAERYGIRLEDPQSVARAGLRVYTTLDPRLQALAEQAIVEQMAAADEAYGIPAEGPRPEAAAVVMNPRTGEVLALVGGRTREGMLEFNRATDALRQPGSAIKPIVAYLPALEAGLSPATILDDAPVRLSNDGTTVWPQNFDFRYHGLKPARWGVEQSVNPMAVRAMQFGGGPWEGADLARRMGLTTILPEDENLALALGGIEKGVTVLDLTAAFGVIANMGVKVDPVVITRIVDRTGEVLFEARPREEQVVRPGAAYLMIDMMKGVIRRGTAYAFTGGFRGWPAAGKTGTTEENRDAWFIGFTPELVTGVWTGYDNPDNHLPWTGAYVPVQIWNRIMTQAVTEPPEDWPRPADVVTVTVCRLTGMLPDDNCPPDQVVPELFLAGHEPATSGNLLVKAKAVQVTVPAKDGRPAYTQWQLWQPGCAGTPVERLFIRRPEPLVRHPTDPWNPRYIPADAADELPTVTCEPSQQRQPRTFWNWLTPLGEWLSPSDWPEGDEAGGPAGEEPSDAGEDPGAGAVPPAGETPGRDEARDGDGVRDDDEAGDGDEVRDDGGTPDDGEARDGDPGPGSVEALAPEPGGVLHIYDARDGAERWAGD